MAPDKAKAVPQNVQPELTFVWDMWKVPHEAQAQMVALGFDELDLFAEMGDSPAESARS